MCLRWIVYLHLSLSEGLFDRLFLTKHCRCFYTDTKGAEGAVDLLEALSQWTQLEELDFTFCSQIPAAAWHKVRNAKWLNLKKAHFNGFLAERIGWRFSCFLRVLLRIYLSLLNVVRVQICIDLWSCLMSPSWPVWVSDGLGTCTYRCLNVVFSTDCFWQNTAGASTLTRKEQRAPQICFKRWVSRHSWKTWFLMAVIRSQQQRGKKFVVQSGSTWRRQISHGASQREMVEGFLVSYVYLFVSVGCCPSSDL